MRLPPLLLSIALVTGAAAAQTLDCPGSAGARCDTFHFHVQMYRPDTRGFAEVYGINQFSSQAACERARDAAMKRNLAVVDFFKRVRNESQYEPDRFGTCHCDMTIDKANPRFLTDAQRTAQLRLAEDIRQKVRERLMDADITTDSELIRDVGPAPVASSPLGGPKLVPLPPNAPASQVATAAADLKATRTVEPAKPPSLAMDVPLVDVPLPGGAPAAAPAAASVETPTVTPPAPETTAATASNAAESFITYETQRIQNVLKASTTISDDALKSRIYDACNDRSQMLSNLRALIEGSTAKSRLADFARGARTENERVAFVGKLFGDEVKPHWAPADPKDLIIEPRAEIDADPERVLRDASGKFNAQQRKRALYMLLARSQPTEQQQLWLATVADSFLQ
jgi:hypothetical protein